MPPERDPESFRVQERQKEKRNEVLVILGELFIEELVKSRYDGILYWPLEKKVAIGRCVYVLNDNGGGREALYEEIKKALVREIERGPERFR